MEEKLKITDHTLANQHNNNKYEHITRIGAFYCTTYKHLQESNLGASNCQGNVEWLDGTPFQVGIEHVTLYHWEALVCHENKIG